MSKFFITTRKYILLSEALLASYKILLQLTNILKDQKRFWRIKGLTFRDESGRQRKVGSSNAGIANLNVTFYNGTSA